MKYIEIPPHKMVILGAVLLWALSTEGRATIPFFFQQGLVKARGQGSLDSKHTRIQWIDSDRY